MRRHRTDGPHREIRRELRKVTVCEEISQADGMPDFVARHLKGWPVFLEVKGAKTPIAPHQAAFGIRWGGYWVVVRTVDEAMMAIGAMT